MEDTAAERATDALLIMHHAYADLAWAQRIMHHLGRCDDELKIKALAHQLAGFIIAQPD